MKHLVVPVFAALLAAAALGATASGRSLSTSGDTCTATGNGTAYTLNISIPSGAPQQFGFAFGASGASVTNANIGGASGQFSTVNLPTGSTGAWMTLTPMLPGSAVASLTTSAAVKGSFFVMPAASAQKLEPERSADVPGPGQLHGRDRRTAEQRLQRRQEGQLRCKAARLAHGRHDSGRRHGERRPDAAHDRYRLLAVDHGQVARPGQKPWPEERRHGDSDVEADLTRARHPLSEGLAQGPARRHLQSEGWQVGKQDLHPDAQEVTSDGPSRLGSDASRRRSRAATSTSAARRAWPGWADASCLRDGRLHRLRRRESGQRAFLRQLWISAT